MYPAQILICMLLLTSSRKNSKMAENNSKWPIYCDFSHFMSIYLPCGRYNFHLHAANSNNQFSINFNNGDGLFSSCVLVSNDFHF